ncbi:Predicted protein [Taphrina deformans PYCC 5710]|uniref:XPG-I domain-containing protein n=1 Tax=Taphrina deformans (strain PYCC 5710 / ATCC 11124 / CBS 356.35 / IMI 108563 / JCM 9778 / NBRC 8474) TaxID=1097556 RepID=R4XCA2_TAPDE|nr:Predicted protein [Taphrina deformans PYCC 5710]|eukprot:CCG83451.1 Predicted protein [Taphrina deformans PYCC 5710]
MGVAGLWEVFAGSQDVQSISALTKTNETLKVAVDISIWLFQCAAASGGDCPVLRTFYYRLCRLASANIRAVFVFDGPQRPKFKRGRRVNSRHRELTAFRSLVRYFGFLTWDAPGEAEAEAALLQSQGLVDAVLSDDVDTLLFGATVVYRNWSAVDAMGRKSKKVLNHTLRYSAKRILQECQLDVDGMILIALLAGGDYIPLGLPGCGIKTAVEIAKAGFGKSLALEKDNLGPWRDKLQESLRNNPDGKFTTRHPGLRVPPSFPDLEIYNYYVTPVVTNVADMLGRAQTLDWNMPIRTHAIQEFTSDFLGWQGIQGDLKIMRTLSQPVLIGHMATFTQSALSSNHKVTFSQGSGHTQSFNLKLYGKRQAPDCQSTSEFRIGYNPEEVVPLDLHQQSKISDSPEMTDTSIATTGPSELDIELCEGSDDTSLAHRLPTLSDPNTQLRIWIPESLVKKAYPQLVDEWYAAQALKSPQKLKSRAKQVLGKPTTLDQFGFSTMKVPLQSKKALPTLPSNKISGDQVALILEGQTLPPVCRATSNLCSELIDLTLPPANQTRVQHLQRFSSSVSINSTENRYILEEKTGASDAKVQSTKLASLAGRARQSNIKSYFGVTKNGSDVESKAQCPSKVQLQPQRADILGFNSSCRNKIVIQEDFLGAWRFAEETEPYYLETSGIIDLS